MDVAYFGSAQMIDEKTIFMGCGKNRTFAYLQENPNAVFAIMEPGQTPAEWKGVRVYLKMTECQTSGEKLDSLKAQLRAKAGEGGREHDACGDHLRGPGGQALRGLRTGLGEVHIGPPAGRRTMPAVLVACKVLEKEIVHSLPPDVGVEVLWLDAGLHASLPRLEEALRAALEGRSLRNEKRVSSTGRAAIRR